MSSDNYRKSFTPELVQGFIAKVMVVCRQTITAKVSHQNWCKVSQQKSVIVARRQTIKMVSHGRLSFRANAHNDIFSGKARYHWGQGIAGFQCHAIQNKNQNHSIDKVQILRKERR